MRKHVVIAAVALVVAGTSFAVAQQFRGERGERDRFHRWQPTADDIAAFADARIAGMKAGLRLNADQEKNWPAFEEAYRGLAKQRAERRAMRENEPGSGDIVQFMQRRAEIMTQRAAGFKKLADAASPLYQSLDEAQKRRFSVLARMLRPQPMFTRERGHHMERDNMGPRGPGRFHERGGNFERPRFGEERRFDRGDAFRTGTEDELFQDRADELEFANLGHDGPRIETPQYRD